MLQVGAHPRQPRKHPRNAGRGRTEIGGVWCTASLGTVAAQSADSAAQRPCVRIPHESSPWSLWERLFPNCPCRCAIGRRLLSHSQDRVCAVHRPGQAWPTAVGLSRRSTTSMADNASHVVANSPSSTPVAHRQSVTTSPQRAKPQVAHLLPWR